MENEKPKGSAVLCVRDVRKLPLEAYRLSTDGRKWKYLCQQRRALAMELATYADPDGSNIKVGTATLAQAFGWAPHTLFARLDDLEALGMHVKHDSYTAFGTRARSINVDWLEFAKYIWEKWKRNGRNPDDVPEIVQVAVVRRVQDSKS